VHTYSAPFCILFSCWTVLCCAEREREKSHSSSRPARDPLHVRVLNAQLINYSLWLGPVLRLFSGPCLCLSPFARSQCVCVYMTQLSFNYRCVCTCTCEANPSHPCPSSLSSSKGKRWSPVPSLLFSHLNSFLYLTFFHSEYFHLIKTRRRPRSQSVYLFTNRFRVCVCVCVCVCLLSFQVDPPPSWTFYYYH